MRALTASLVSVGLLALALGGCGGRSDSDAQASGNAAFGPQASPAQKAAIEETTTDFLAAEAKGRWGQACALMAATVRTQLAVMKHGESCATTLATLFKQNPAQLQAAATGVTIKDARVNGSQGYVFYSTPKTASAYLPLQFEGRHWNVATISGSSAPSTQEPSTP